MLFRSGLGSRTTDAAFLWLPVELKDLDYEVLLAEQRFVALSSKHPLANRKEINFAELADESFVALPRSAGSLREFWLGSDSSDGRSVKVAAEVNSADETFEIVSSGAAVVLLAEGNAVVYARPGIKSVPVIGLEPAQLVVAWRRGDGRPAVDAFIRACSDAIAS